MYRLSIRFLFWTELLAALFFGLLLCLSGWVFEGYPFLRNGSLCLIGGAFLYFSAFYLPVYRRNFRMDLTSHLLYRRSGVWFCKEDVCSFLHISSVRLLQTPLLRWFSLAILIGAMPGYRLVLVGLDIRDAQKIVDAIKRIN